MLKRSVWVGTFFLGSSILYAAAEPTPLPSGSATPSVSVRSGVSPTPINKNVLLREFSRAQKSELKALEHRHKFEMKELKASQEAREKEWKKAEAESRHKFFEAHPKGTERRAYVQEFLQRRDALHKSFVDERSQRKQEQDARLTAIRQDQMLRFTDFKKELDNGKSPATSLWPRPGN